MPVGRYDHLCGDEGMTITERNAPALIDESGEIVRLEMLPVSADQAGTLLPKVYEHLKAVRRFAQYLEDALSAQMATDGQTERLIDGRLWECKPEVGWEIEDEGAMFALLAQSLRDGQITEAEFIDAVQQEVVYRFDNGRLNALAKRLPAIDGFRRRVEGKARLRLKPSR